MTYSVCNRLQASARASIMHAFAPSSPRALLCLALLCLSLGAAAQQAPPPKGDDLDVTMQIITDPDAKQPDEVVRRIPLPARKPSQAAPAAGNNAETGSGKADKEAKERARSAQETGREASERAK